MNKAALGRRQILPLRGFIPRDSSITRPKRRSATAKRPDRARGVSEAIRGE